MLALEIPILLIFIFIDIFRTRDLSFKERLKKRWFPYTLVFLVFFVPRIVNDHYFEEIHGRKFGRPEGEGNPEHHSIDYDRCLRNASLLTVGFCEWISGDYWKTVESECIDNQIFSGGLCNVKLKEKYQSLATDEKKLEYTKYLLKQLEQKQTEYARESIVQVSDKALAFSKSVSVSKYLMKYSFDRCYNKNNYHMCILFYFAYKEVFPNVRDSSLRLTVDSLKLFLAEKYPNQVSKQRKLNTINSVYTEYLGIKEKISNSEIEEKVKEIYKNIGTDIPEEVMFYYKKFLNGKKEESTR